MELSFWITNAFGRFFFCPSFVLSGHKETRPETGTDQYKKVTGKEI
jgi:hypothetical protein